MSPNTPDRRRAVEQNLAEAVRRRRDLQQELDRRDPAPHVGDVYVFSGPPLEAFRWTVLLKHPNRPRLFVVPADTAPLVGSADVEVARPKLGDAMVLRCALGCWINVSEFRPHLRSAFVDEHYVQRAQAKLEEIAQGQLKGTALQREIDASPSYDEWIDEAQAAVEFLREMHARRQTISLAGAPVIRLSDRFPGAEAAAEPQLTLAAAPGFEELLQPAPPSELHGQDVAYPCPGRLLLVREGTSVSIRYLAAEDEEPPPLAQVQLDGQTVAVAWRNLPNRHIAWAEIATTAGSIQLRFGAGEEAREITVESA
jgi:hypothetical protein